MTAPEAVVLDLGNVVLGWDPYGPFVGRMDRAAVDEFFADVDFAAFNHRQDAGRSWADARADVAERFPQHVGAVDLYVEHFVEALSGPVPGMEALVRDLLAAGVRVVGLTNWSAETFHHAELVAPAVGLMEGVVVSGETGLAKPDPRIFELTARRFGLTPARTVFVDDSRPNVEAAARVGFDAVLFTSADRLRADLAVRGLDLPAS
ncbi:HAD family phosphatase [Cellulomonas sp.]|uniref:HAD family hydrolase n=1 Tax=Cellulomonas sp. TaxID=40001 RepID=UPI0025C185D5|nr:HAD family phosphatase [Cellulomonas sp.]